MSIGKQIHDYRVSLGISQDELAKRAGYTHKSCISKIENDKRLVSYDKLTEFARIFNCSVSDLIGDRAESVSMSVVGDIAAGFGSEPSLSYDSDYKQIPAEWFHGQPKDNFMLLRVRGNSMYPDIKENDLCLIHIQPTCESGQIAACLYDTEYASLKEVRFGNDYIDMIPYNRSGYEVKHITGSETDNFLIFGVLWKVIREYT